MKKLLTIIILILLTVMLTGCKLNLFEAAKEPPKATGLATVKIIPTGFLPATLKVNTGTVVLFTNTDTLPHELNLNSGKIAYNPITLEKGQTSSLLLNTAGETTFYTDSGEFTGKIVVE